MQAHSTRAARTIFTGVLALALGACAAVGPDFQGLKTHPGDAPSSGKAATWAPVTLSVFHDPVLRKLVAQAQKDNPTVAQAQARLAQARLTYEGTQAVQGIGLGAQASLSRQRAAQGGPVHVTTSTAAADASWQLDLFGGQRRQLQELDALQHSQAQSLQAARIALAAQVASAYVNVRGCERQVPVYVAAVRTEQALLRLAQAQYVAGTVSLEATQQAQLSSAAAQQQLVSEQSACADDRHVLQGLTSLGTSELNKLLSQGQALWPALKAPPTMRAVPAFVVLQRPDVRAAFEQARAQSAAIGVQEAQLLPSFTLVGNIGLNNANLGGQGAWTHTWSFGPALNIPTLDPRVVLYANKQARAAFDVSVQAWRTAVRSAALDVQNTLTALSQSQQMLRIDKASFTAQARLLSLAHAQHAAGTIPKQTVLTAELSRQAAWLNQDSAQQTVLQGWIALFKATASSSY